MTRFVNLRALAFTLLPLLTGAEQKPLPKDLPPYGELKSPAPLAVSQSRLDNGLTIWLVPKPGFPKVALAVCVRGGRTADPKDRPGIADLLAAVMNQGTKTRTARQIAEELQNAGGDISVDATADFLRIEVEVLSGKTRQGMDLVADVVQNAAFADGEVELAKRNQLSRLEADQAQPGFLARRALYQALYGEHPYSVLGLTKESITATTSSDLRREYARRLRPDQAVLVAVGDFDEATMRAFAAGAFGAWRAPSGEAPALAPKPPSEAPRRVVFIPRQGSVQTTFYVGAVGPTVTDPDYPAARVANAIYGGMFGSRLTSNIREDKGYTYSPFSQIAPLQLSATLITQADVRNAVTGASYNEIAYELNRIATTSPDAAELERAKRYLIGSSAMRLQSRSSVARSLAGLWINGLPPEELAAQSAKLETVSAKDVEAAGKKYLSAARMSVVAVGDEKVIREELAPFRLAP